MEGGPESSHALLVYETALQKLRSVDCEVASGWWWVVVTLLLAKANVYTKLGDRRARKRLLNAIVNAGQSSTLTRDDFTFTCQMADPRACEYNVSYADSETCMYLSDQNEGDNKTWMSIPM
jgi:hypothetical protein